MVKTRHPLALSPVLGEDRAGPWTADELAKATKMRREGRSAEYIRQALGRSRNSVIGALWRAGVPAVRRGTSHGEWGKCR